MQDFEIIFVPGMKPKPPLDAHREQLLRCLQAGLSRARAGAAETLARHTDRFRLFSWTYDFHGSHRDLMLDLPGIDRLLANPDPTDEEIREIESLGRRFKRLTHVLGDAVPTLGRWLAPADLRISLREARRYLLNRKDAAIAVRDGLGAMIRSGAQRAKRVLVLSHSLGTVIAYDTLWQMSHEDAATPRIDLFVTLGSPITTRFVRRHLKGREFDGVKRYPTNIRRWRNFTAKGELVAFRRVRPLFSEMLELGIVEDVTDRMGIYNHFHAVKGINPHKSYGYLAHPEVGRLVGDWIEGEAYSS